MAEAQVRRAASFGRNVQVSAARPSSALRAAIAAITRGANHGPAMAAYDGNSARRARAARIFSAAARQFAQASVCSFSDAGAAASNSDSSFAFGAALATSSSCDLNWRHSARPLFRKLVMSDSYDAL